ncbi:glycosyltransferase family 9 protein [Inquilinus sp. CAU 1745]|uniref:glycosyltransferase family 9 protein n=1 Tax=Inquilinus sp. CAU 1745 TaxID=3140369 RepID=UPI00325BE593
MVDEEIDRWLTEQLPGRFIVVIPGSSARHPEKRWPGYAALAAMLIDDGYQVVTVPGPDELELSRTIPGTTITGTGPYLNYFGLAAVLNRAAFVIGNDTGPSHLAAHLGIPGLALFGGAHSPASTGIERERFSALQVDRLNLLDPATVYERVRALIARHQVG